MMQEHKKVCVITGGSSGMGFATAKRMGKKGYTLVLAARTPEKLERALSELKKDGIEVTACRCDISDESSVRNLVSAVGGIATWLVRQRTVGISKSA